MGRKRPRIGEHQLTVPFPGDIFLIPADFGEVLPCQQRFECYFLPPFEMKKDIHPETYRPVVFKDSASGFTFLGKSCARSKQTITWEEDGSEYPLVVLGISSASHPFYTGQQVFVDTAGRVDKFQQRLAKTKAAQEQAAAFKKKRR